MDMLVCALTRYPPASSPQPSLPLTVCCVFPGTMAVRTWQPYNLVA